MTLIKEKTDLKVFVRFLLPTLGGMLITCIYSIVDTIFIGRYSGETGLSALNIVLPLYSYLYGLGAFFGVGGSILYCVAKGRGDEGRNKYFTMAAIMLLGVLVILTAVLNIWFWPFMNFMGASGADDPERLKLIGEYGRFVTWGALVIGFNGFMNVFVRSDGAPNLAMIATVTGGILNIVLDYILMFPLDMGMRGAAMATLISMGVSLCICLAYFFSKKCGLKIDIRGAQKTILGILKSGVPTLTVDFSFGITMMLFNIQLQRVIGAYAVSVYSVVCNIVMIIAALFAAVSATLQPLISVSYGEGNKRRIKNFFRMGLISVAALSVVSYAFIIIKPTIFAQMFIANPSAELLRALPAAIRIYGTCLFLIGINFCIGIYYQATLRAARSFIISALRGLIFCVIFMYLIPVILPDYLYGLWWVVPLSEVFTFITAVTMGFVSSRCRSRDNKPA